MAPPPALNPPRASPDRPRATLPALRVSCRGYIATYVGSSQLSSDAAISRARPLQRTSAAISDTPIWPARFPRIPPGSGCSCVRAAVVLRLEIPWRAWPATQSALLRPVPSCGRARSSVQDFFCADGRLPAGAPTVGPVKPYDAMRTAGQPPDFAAPHPRSVCPRRCSEPEDLDRSNDVRHPVRTLYGSSRYGVPADDSQLQLFSFEASRGGVSTLNPETPPQANTALPPFSPHVGASRPQRNCQE